MEERKNRQGKKVGVLERFLPFLTIKFLLISLLFIGSLFVFAFLGYVALHNKVHSIDSSIAHYFSSYATPGVIAWMERITVLGSSRFLFPAYIVLVAYFLVKKKYQTAINIVVLAFTAYALTNALKQWINRPRPAVPLIESLKTGSFPSGHTISAFVFCMIIVYLVSESNLQKVWKWILTMILLGCSLMVGLSRIILQMHYPTDVIGGFCFGVVWVLISFWVFRSMEKKRAVDKSKHDQADQRFDG